MRSFCLPALLLALLPALSSCGGETTPPAPPPAATASRLLDADLDDAIGVLAAKEAEEDAKVEIYGRVRATANGVFTLVDDDHVKYCGQDEGCMDDCKTPWDYCCENPDEVKRATIVVEAFDETGGRVPKEALGIRPLDLVALQGTLTRDADGTVVLRASWGWFRRERPVVELDVRFP